MDAMLFLQKLIQEGEVSIPDGTNSIEVNRHDVTFYDVDDDYITCDWFENEQIAYDEYQYEVSGEFTLEEFDQWCAENPTALQDYYESVRKGLVRLAVIADEIQSLIKQGKEISKKTGAPFELTVDGVSFDIRTLAHVDWNSSSMYC